VTVSDLSCDDVRDAAPGYALGVVDDDTRTAVSRHTRRCPGCREVVSRTVASAGWLLDLDSRWEGAPDADDTEPLGKRRRHLRRFAAMATVTMLVAGTAFGGAVRVAGEGPSSSGSTAPLYRAGSVVGEVEVDSGSAPLIRLVVSGLGVEGSLSVETVASDGATQRLGTFELHDGRGYWAGPLGKRLSNASELVLADTSGQVVAGTSVT
jgi:hypothetical protein